AVPVDRDLPGLRPPARARPRRLECPLSRPPEEGARLRGGSQDEGLHAAEDGHAAVPRPRRVRRGLRAPRLRPRPRRPRRGRPDPDVQQGQLDHEALPLRRLRGARERPRQAGAHEGDVRHGVERRDRRPVDRPRAGREGHRLPARGRPLDAGARLPRAPRGRVRSGADAGDGDASRRRHPRARRARATGAGARAGARADVHGEGAVRPSDGLQEGRRGARRGGGVPAAGCQLRGQAQGVTPNVPARRCVMRFEGVYAVLAGFALTAAAATAQEAKARPDPVRAAVEKQNAAFAAAFARGDTAAVAAAYADDAIAFPPDGAMVRGRAAIEALWRSLRDAGGKAITLSTIDVHSSGSLAAETGTAVLKLRPPNGAE